MGEIVMAAKVTHVPSIWMSEQYERFHGIRQFAIDALGELGRRADERGVESFVIFDCHWIVNQGFHLNAKPRHEGIFTSHELPHFLQDMPYGYDGDPALGEAIVERVKAQGLSAMAHDTAHMGLEYGTLIPMRYANADGAIRVVPVAANQYASIDEGRQMGAAVAQAIAASGRKVALLASGSMSHQFWPNHLSEQGLQTVNTEFNKQVDLRVLQLWQEGQIAPFLEMLPDYAERCVGECGMIDTAMLFGALGWDRYRGKGETLCDYFGSSGTGQVVVDFELAA